MNKIKDVIAVGQYQINDKLVTFIGENHYLEYPEGSGLTPLEYIRKSLKRNPNIILLLEKGDYKIHSKNINEISKNLPFINIDRRKEFINQELLYSNHPFSSVKQIFNDFIRPFYKKQHLFTLPYSFKKKDISYLRSYLKDIDKHAKKISKALNNPKSDFSQLRKDLLDLWKKVMDYFIVAEVLRLNDNNEIIIFAGVKHLENFDKIFEDARCNFSKQSIGELSVTVKNSC